MEKKKRLPNPVGVPRRGPLKLKSSAKPHDRASTETIRCTDATQTPSSPKRRRALTYPPSEQQPRHSLTRFPIPMLQRPMENLERELGQLSCAELLEGVSSLRVSRENGRGLDGCLSQAHLICYLYNNKRTSWKYFFCIIQKSYKEPASIHLHGCQVRTMHNL